MKVEYYCTGATLETLEKDLIREEKNDAARRRLREAVFWALSEIPHPKAQQLLGEAQLDEDGSVREAAHAALKRSEKVFGELRFTSEMDGNA